MSDTIRYVAGLLFDDNGSRLALIHKDRGPSCVKGHYNAIGGKCNPGESSQAAMQREFREEAGAVVTEWELFLELKGEGFHVDFFCCFSSASIAKVSTQETEKVRVFYAPVWIRRIDAVKDLQWIVPMALLTQSPECSRVYEITETRKVTNSD